MNAPFILGVNGSPHLKGNVAHILNLVLSGARKEGAKTEIIHLYKLKIIHNPGYYSEDPKKEIPKNMPKDDIVRLYPKIIKADGLVLATPVYWANMSGVMKEFIDHLTALENDNFKLEGKVAAFIAASKENEGGRVMAAMSMATALIQMGVYIPPYAVMWYPGGSIYTKHTIKSWAVKDAPIIGKNMVKLINLLKRNPIKFDY